MSISPVNSREESTYLSHSIDTSTRHPSLCTDTWFVDTTCPDFLGCEGEQHRQRMELVVVIVNDIVVITSIVDIVIMTVTIVTDIDIISAVLIDITVSTIVNVVIVVFIEPWLES